MKTKRHIWVASKRLAEPKQVFRKALWQGMLTLRALTMLVVRRPGLLISFEGARVCGCHVMHADLPIQNVIYPDHPQRPRLPGALRRCAEKEELAEVSRGKMFQRETGSCIETNSPIFQIQ